MQKGKYSAEEKSITLQSELVGNASKVIKADCGTDTSSDNKLMEHRGMFNFYQSKLLSKHVASD